MKKRISLILVFAMLVSLIVPFTIPTASADGTAITDQSELYEWDGTGSRYLANDITISGTWNYSTIIYGTFDGQGHTITFTNGATIYGGLFQNVAYGATIKNLNVVQAGSATWKMVKNSATGIYNSAYCIGGLIAGIYGVSENTTDMYVENVTVTANINVTEAQNGEITVGGITGQIRNTYAHLTNCTFNGSITDTTVSHGTNSAFGGIVGMTVKGKTKAILTNCLNNGNVTAYCNVGGIVGWSRRWDSDSIKALIIQKCVNRGAVTCSGNAYAGGIIAYISGSGTAGVQTYILNNINYGSVNITYGSTSYPAGICGYLQYGSSAQNQINGNVNYGTLSATSGTAAPILNRLTDGTVNCAAEKNYAVTYESGTYHTLFTNSSEGANTVVTALNGTYNGISVTYVVNNDKVSVLWNVTTVVQLAQMDGNGAYSLSNDLTLSGTWSYSKIFKGHFDGGNHTITFANGITITGGLFQELQAGAYIHDLKIVQANGATWNYYTSGVGAVAGSIGAVAAFVGANGDQTEANLKAEANKVRIENVTATVSISKSAAVSGSNEAAAIGGIVGSLCTYTAITRCTVNGLIADSYDHNGTNTSAASNAELSAYGGIVGLSYRRSKLDVTECINNASVTGKGQQGGILGGSTSVNNAENVCTVTIQRCINNGTITCNGTATTSSVGGIAGYIFSQYMVETIKNNINNGSLAKVKDSTAYAAGIVARIRRGQNNKLYFLGNIQRSSSLAGGNNIIYHEDGSGNYTNNHSYTYDFFAHVKNEVDAMITLNANYSNTFVFRNNKVTLKWTDSTSFNTITSFIGVQTSDTVNAKRSIRILAGTTNNLTVNSVGVEVTVFYGSNGGNKTFYDSNTRVHGFIYAAGQKVTAASQGVSYIYTAKLNNVPTSLGTVTLLIRTYHKVGSQKYYSDYSAMTLNLAS